jgi:hypothetical protein
LPGVAAVLERVRKRASVFVMAHQGLEGDSVEARWRKK